MQKSKALSDLLVRNFGKKVKICKSDSPLYVRCVFDVKLSSKDIQKQLLEKGVAVITSEKNNEVAFSVSSVPVKHLEKATEIVKSTLVVCKK